MSMRRSRAAEAADVAAAPMRPWLALLITGAIFAVVILAGVGIQRYAVPQPSGAFARCHTATQVAPRLYAGPPPMCINPNRPYSATVKTSKGDITMALLTGAAPKTVNNFIVLAVNGFYNGLEVFRVEDWVVQGGDPLNSGRGGPGYMLPEETPTKDETWQQGSVGMARFPGDGISGSQFFLTKQPWPGGPPMDTYNHFGTVTLGFDIVGALTPGDRILRVEVK